MKNNNEQYFEEEILYDPWNHSLESKLEVIKKCFSLFQSASELLVEDENTFLNSSLPEQFRTTKEAIQNSIDAIIEKGVPWKIRIKVRVRKDRETIEVFIKDSWIGSNSKWTDLKRWARDKFIGEYWIWEKSLKQFLDKYKRVSSKNWSIIFMRLTNKDYIEKLLSRLTKDEIEDLLN